MTTITQNVAAKFAVAFVAIAMAFSVIAPVAQAEDLSSMSLEDLIALVNQLQAQMGQGSAPATSCDSIPAPLTIGAQNANVTALQNYLIGAGESIPAGATGYFGTQTQAALASWQAKNGVSPAVGYYGPITKAAIDAKCTPSDDMDDSDDSDDSSSVTLKGEGTLDDGETDLDDASDTDIMEGEEDAEIGVVTLAAIDGDILVSRLTFTLVADSGNEEKDPWDVFDEISLWVDGDKVADFEADDEDNYLDEDAGEFRFSNIGLVIEEDEDVEITVAANVAGAVDGSDVDAANWALDLTDIRYFDADDVATTDTISVSAVEFDILEEGTDDSAEIKSNSDSPDAATLKVDDGNDDSDEYEIFVFDIEVDKDSSDLVLNDNAYIDITVENPSSASGSTTADDVIDAVWLDIDGTEVDGDETTTVDSVDDEIATGSSATIRYEFDFDNMDFEADETYEATVTIRFKGQDGNYENNVVVSASTSGALWEMEGLADDNVLTGTDVSEDFTLATVVPVITDTSFSNDRNEAGDAGTISFEFTLGAEDDDFDFGVANKNDVDGSTDDIMFTLSGTDTTIATAAITKVSGDATATGAGWTISDGDEATFVLDVTFTTASSADDGVYRVTVDTIGGVEIDETSDGMSLTN